MSKHEGDLIEARNGWAVFCDAASRTDDLETTERAHAALVRFLAKNESDGTWQDFRPHVERYLEEFVQSAKQRGYRRELEGLLEGRKAWQVREYRDALAKCRAVEDAMGPQFDRERFEQLGSAARTTSRLATSYSDAQLAVIRALKGELGIRATTLRITQLKESGKSPEEVAKLAGQWLDALPLDVLYASNVEAVRRWLGEAWDDLHSLSQNYLPKAEAVLDFLERANEKERSPFVLEYCRALEN